jgi:uncharacterized membrane protein
MSKKKWNWWRWRNSRTTKETAAADFAREASYTEAASHVDRHLPVLFLVLGLAIGLLYTFVMPPLQVADEIQHFARLYSVSRGICIASPDIDMPKSFAQLNELFPGWLETRRKISIAELRSSLKMPSNESVMAGNARQRSLDGFINQNLYCCLPYVPAAVVLNAGRHLGLSPLALMYVSRVSNLAAYLALTFFALRLLPDFRWVLFCVALMPMAMHQAASVSADSTGFALTFLLCAYVFRLAFMKQTETIGTRQYAALGMLILLAALSRSQLAVVALPLVIPPARFRSRRNRRLAIAAYTLLVVLCVGFWQHVNQPNFERLAEERITRPRAGLPVVDVHSNVRFFYEHPVETASIFVHSMTDFDYMLAISKEMVGKFGWLSVSLPDWLVFLYLGLLVAAAATQIRDTNLTGFARGMLLLFVTAGAANTMAAGWVLETPRAVLDVPTFWKGFRVYSQGRYWIPLAFPALILLANTKARLNPRVFAGIAVAVILIANGVAIDAIHTTYYN